MRGYTGIFRPTPRAYALSALLLAATLAAAPAGAAPELTTYGRLPHTEDVVLSGDATRIAFLRTDGDERVVSVFSRADHKFVRGVKVGQQKVRWIQWADADHLLITVSKTAVPLFYIGDYGEMFQVLVFDVGDGSLTVVPQNDPLNHIELMNTVLGRPTVRHVDGHTMLFLRAEQTSSMNNVALVRVDLQTHTTRVVQPAREIGYRWLIDNAGEIALDESYNPDTRHWRIVMHRDGHAREVAAGQEHLEYPYFVGWGPEPDTVLLEQIEDGDPVWRLLSLKDGTIGAPLAERKRFEAPIENPVNHRMIGGRHVEDSQELTFFDTVTRYSWEMVLGYFPGERVRLASHSDDFRKFIVRVESPQKGYRYVLVDLDTHQLASLGEVYEGIKPYEVRRINYPAADGTSIPAYLTLPDRPAKSLPLVVLPHGGPEARDTIDFDWWSQGLASLGYAVLRPNYRGSALAFEFVSKGFGEWGRKMQTDLSDGVRYLAKEGIVDPKRVCIVGASYGGYAALAGPSLDPGVYRCAVSVAGIGDVHRMLIWDNARTGQRHSYVERYWDRYMGIKGPGDPIVDVISPIKHLEAINAPILLIHGKDDTVVDYEQSQVMYDALRGAKKDVEFVTLKHEDHWLSHSDTRLQMLQATAAFLRAHNPPD
jgi:dipeptidyl aminopeptidase/acylaminoacyl peptidase